MDEWYSCNQLRLDGTKRRTLTDPRDMDIPLKPSQIW